MKANYIIAAIAAIVCLTACHKGRGNDIDNTDTQIDTVMTDNVWTKVDPMEFSIDPITTFSKDWMALATGTKKGFNSMTVSWGTVGYLWNKPVVIVFVSKDRYSKKLMDDNQYFTLTGFPKTKECRRALEYIGSHSQKDDPDKTAHAGLSVEFTTLGNPVFSEGNLAIECKKIYSDEFETDKMPKDVMESLYARMGMHSFYIGEIVNVLEKK